MLKHFKQWFFKKLNSVFIIDQPKGDVTMKKEMKKDMKKMDKKELKKDMKEDKKMMEKKEKKGKK